MKARARISGLALTLAGISLAGLAWFLAAGSESPRSAARALPGAPARAAVRSSAADPGALGASAPAAASARAQLPSDLPWDARPDAQAATDTWSARLFAAATSRPLAGVVARIQLLSPYETRSLTATSDSAGNVGPLALDARRFPAAEITIDPGADWAGARRLVRFRAGARNHDAIGLEPAAELRIETVDARTGAPLAQVRVQLTRRQIEIGSGEIRSGEAFFEGVSGADGRLRFTWREAGGPFAIDASREGYRSLTTVELAAPPERDLDLRLLLSPTGDLLARVVDAAGSSTGSRVEVRVMPGRDDERGSGARAGVRSAAEPWTDSVDESGPCAFSALPCEVPLLVTAITPDGRTGETWTRIPAPGATQEVVVEVASAEALQVLTLDDRGRPLAGVTVGNGARILGASDEAGRVRVASSDEVAGGELWASKAGWAFAWTAVVPGVAAVALRLEPERTVTGIVTDADGFPLERVRLVPCLGDGAGSAAPRERGERLLGDRSIAAQATTDAQGRFCLRGLPGGWLDLHLRPSKGAPFRVRDVVAGAQGLVIVVPEEADYGKELGIALAVSVVDGSTGRPVHGASVHAFHAEAQGAKSSKEGRTSATDDLGNTRFAFALEGFYWVEASADGYAPAGTEIRDYPVGEHAVQLELAPCGSLSLRVAGSDGKARPGLWISARTPGGDAVLFEHSEGGASWTGEEILSDLEGRARASDMRPGRILLEARAERGGRGEPLARAEVEIAAGARREVELVLP